jgi:hypothetical protein
MKKLLIVLFPFLSVAQIDNVALQEEFGKLLNEYRISKGKTPVTFNADAKAAAKIQADYLASTWHLDTSGKYVGKVGHIHPDPNLKGPHERVLAVNPTYDSLFANNILGVCENAASLGSGELTTKQLAAKALDIWIKSPGHNAALLDNYSINLEFGIYASTVIIELPYYEYVADPATMSSKSVLKYIPEPIYSVALVFITKIVW